MTASGPPPRIGSTSASPSLERRASARIDVRDWLGGVRLSGFAVIMLGLVVLGVLVLAPTIGTYVSQRQQIAAAQHAVQLTREQIADLGRQRERWKDPAYITTEARARLYYVKPGEVVYLVDDDLPAAQLPQEVQTVDKKVEKTPTDWMSQLVRSVASAGLARTATSVTVPTGGSAPSPTGGAR